VEERTALEAARRLFPFGRVGRITVYEIRGALGGNAPTQKICLLISVILIYYLDLLF
jgi:hypothetical protein